MTKDEERELIEKNLDLEIESEALKLTIKDLKDTLQEVLLTNNLDEAQKIARDMLSQFRS